MLHLSYWWLFILLHRPFFQRKNRQIHSTDREIDHVKVRYILWAIEYSRSQNIQLCRRASENIMELLATWRTLYTLRYCPITLIQCVFSAGTVYLLTSVQASSGTRVAQKDLRHSMEQQTRVLQYLQEIGKSWQCATNIAGIMKTLMHEQLKPLLERKTIPISASHSGALFLSEYGDDDDDEGSLTGRVRRRSSLTKPKSHRLGVHSRNHSVNNLSSSQPSPSSISVSLSPVITISHARQDSPAAYAASSSSPARSAPITIQPSANTRESSFSSTSPSSFTDSWALRSHNIPVSSVDSPSQAFTSPMYSPSSLSGSAPSQSTFGHHDTGSLTGAPHQHLQQYSAYLTSPVPAPAPLDELAFAGSGHTTSHVFTTLDSAFGVAPPPRVPAGADMSAFGGMPGGQTLPQAPSVVGVSFSALSRAFAPEPESAFAFEGQAAGFHNEFVAYGAPAAGSGVGYEEYAAGDMDANMDDGAQWDAWDGSLEF